MTDQQRLEKLLQTGATAVTIGTFEEDHAMGLARDAAIELGRPLVVWSVSGGVQDGLFSGAPPVPQSESPSAALLHFASREDKPICVALDLAPHLKNDSVLRGLRNLLRHFAKSGSTLIMIDHTGDLPAVVDAYMTPFEISLPDEKEIECLLRDTLREAHQERPIEVEINRRALQTILRNLAGLTRRQIRAVVRDCVVDDRRFDADDINTVLARKRQSLHTGGLLEFVEAPVDLSEIGGLRRLKTWLAQRRGALSDKAVEFGLTAPRGVLMLGVQGAGKSLCAKALATGWGRPLLRMDVGALYDRYIGESERRLRESLGQAEMMAPIILWIDEIEKAFASAASQSTDGGLSKRMFGTLLTWMQEHTAPVFLVATANDIEALPPELLRKGRFDEIFFVDLPDADVREQIFGIHLRKRKRDPAAFDLPALAKASEGYSGAEIEQAVYAGLHAAFATSAELTTDHIVKALEESPPLSVTMAERVAALRRWAKGRCVPAD